MFDLQFAFVRERLRKAKAQMLNNRVVVHYSKRDGGA